MIEDVYIGIGTNLGDREGNIARACRELTADDIIIVRQSSVLNTSAVDYVDQPDFLNTIVHVRTDLSAENLLERLKLIENRMGRERTFLKGPRIIDLDMLIYGKRVIITEGLVIPHPGIIHRDFILYHLIELDEDMRDPEIGKLYKEVYYDKKGHDCSSLS
ncbi:MAG: 2-amino-4-hydroxy-6-hydroxymethyldihydropteridine diphosphokinase [Spirochaetes bacterium]|jgi:2-amino-4-hydroxy-6-hydroxymethyldihydropteridine diphosphokinase|nr:2-amino-4-hydroxy-6-hydroxymethyldihydropteridine diphosphokinase [Spirochaetota bacterium]